MTGRKDSLCINLEFVKVSLSRMRRTGAPTFIESFVSKGGKMDTTLINISGRSRAAGETKDTLCPVLVRSWFLRFFDPLQHLSLVRGLGFE